MARVVSDLSDRDGTDTDATCNPWELQAAYSPSMTLTAVAKEVGRDKVYVRESDPCVGVPRCVEPHAMTL